MASVQVGAAKAINATAECLALPCAEARRPKTRSSSGWSEPEQVRVRELSSATPSVREQRTPCHRNRTRVGGGMTTGQKMTRSAMLSPHALQVHPFSEPVNVALFLQP
jgi:hypothetical protein